jgi:hypothetical protein
MVINDPVQPAALAIDLNDLPPDANIFMDNDIPIIQHAPDLGLQPVVQPQLAVNNQNIQDIADQNAPQPMEIQLDQPDNNIQVG